MKLKDLLNHIAGYSTIDRVEIRHRLMPIDSLLFPQCLRKPVGDFGGYANDTVNTFAIVGNALRVNVDHKELDNPEKAKIVITYKFPGLVHEGIVQQSFRVVTVRQQQHVETYIRASEKMKLVSITRDD